MSEFFVLGDAFVPTANLFANLQHTIHEAICFVSSWRTASTEHALYIQGVDMSHE